MRFSVHAALLLLHAVFIAGAPEPGEKPLSNDCPSLACGALEIKFPFSHDRSPEQCNLSGLRFHCSNDNITLLKLPSSQTLAVTAISYNYQQYITVQLPLSLTNPACPWKNLTLPDTAASAFTVDRTTTAILISCMSEMNSSLQEANRAIPISCLSDQGHFVYAISYYLDLDGSLLNCKAVRNHVKPSGPYPLLPPSYGQSFQEMVKSFIKKRQILLWLNLPSEYDDVITTCAGCEQVGMDCGYNKLKGQTFCIPVALDHRKGGKWLRITGICILAFVFAASAVLVYFKVRRAKNKEQDSRLKVKVENFLASYKDSKPTRYTYAAIKKITERFKHKLGEGGFGSVYKGVLPNGIPVAVKMLLLYRGHGKDFVNEVATIGRIHHTNVVRLLGFCLDRSNYALVYEYMPNESLEKFIFSDNTKGSNKTLSNQRLQDIALGIAQGIEYLHQGCDQRILHFDIKPHNILLDYDFNPKISDFGLAKLCARDQSIVTITAARGTMGYIAPEMYSRNFGTVSSKSDVYSFGMALLEMVSGKKCSQPSMDGSDERYLPEEMYDKVVQGKDFGSGMDADGGEEILKKLAIVALWCIQWNPADRPPMTRVVQMLLAEVQTLQLPSKPFTSA